MKKHFLIIVICCSFLLWVSFDMGILKRLFGERSLLKAQAAEQTDSKKKNPQETYTGLRNLALTAKASDFFKVGLIGKHGVYGVLMEMGLPEGNVTLATFITGDVSLYFSTGGGMLGGIGYEKVSNAAIEFNKKADEFVPQSKKTTVFPSPSVGKTIFYILTKDGIYTVQESDDVLESGESNFTALANAGHNVLTEFRIAAEKNK